jgi:hypothetical protein
MERLQFFICQGLLLLLLSFFGLRKVLSRNNISIWQFNCCFAIQESFEALILDNMDLLIF